MHTATATGVIIACAALTSVCHAGGPLYAIDSGIPALGAGPPNGDAFIGLNQFTVEPGGETISSILIQFFSPNASQTPNPATAYLWSDPNNDGLPDDAIALAQADGLAQGQMGFTTFDIPDTFIGAAGTSFFVGVYLTDDPAAGLPSLAYDDAPLPGRSFFMVGDTLDPLNLAGASDFGDDKGPWHIRAQGVPAPGAAICLVGCLLGRGRSRRP